MAHRKNGTKGSIVLPDIKPIPLEDTEETIGLEPDPLLVVRNPTISMVGDFGASKDPQRRPERVTSGPRLKLSSTVSTEVRPPPPEGPHGLYEADDGDEELTDSQDPVDQDIRNIAERVHALFGTPPANPKELFMDSRTGQKPEEPKSNNGLLVGAFVLAIVLCVPVYLTVRGANPDGGEEEAVSSEAVHATEAPADTDDDADAATEPEPPAMSIDPNPTTGYEADEPAAVPTAPVAEAVSGHVPPLPKQADPKPPVGVAPVPPPVVVAPAAAPAVPESLIVSAAGLKPACRAECSWSDVDPKDGYPRTVNGKREIACGAVVYTVSSWTKIADGKERFCFTATGVAEEPIGP